jgi:hypothetical protein
MPALRQAKVEAVNRGFNVMAAESLHRDHAHAQKWLAALTKNERRLAPEAQLRGITVAELAALILTKPDNIADRELRRQTIMMQIDRAQTPAELDALLVTQT